MAGNAALLSVFSIIAKVISALYRVPLTSVLGAEGMGMYQLVFSIYALILALTTGGIPVAVSRLTSENNALKKDSRVVLKNALLSVVGTSVVLAALLCVLSGFVARIQGNEGVKSGYYVIAPAVVFVGALSMFRGWFHPSLITPIGPSGRDRSTPCVFGLRNTGWTVFAAIWRCWFPSNFGRRRHGGCGR